MDINAHPFQNTRIAFESKSDSDLKQSYVLFKVLSYPWMVRWGAWISPILLKIGFKSIIRKTLFKQFVGGEYLKDCSQTVNRLYQYNVGSILDYSVEGKAEERVFDETASEIIASIDNACQNSAIPFSVFKVTGIASMELLEAVSSNQVLSDSQQQTWIRAKNRVQRICDAAYSKQQKLFIDAEESWIQPAIDNLAMEHMQRLNKDAVWIFNTYQFYRKDRLEVLKKHFLEANTLGFKIGAKLVRGAYMEKERARALQYGYEDPIQTSKELTDQDYNAALRFCLEHYKNLAFCAGTHNEESCALLVHEMKLRAIEPNHPHIYFSQLFGMSDHISFNLSHKGYNVAKYLPYGPVEDVLPYLIRRAQENTSVKGQTGRELQRITQELQRRKSL